MGAGFINMLSGHKSYQTKGIKSQGSQVSMLKTEMHMARHFKWVAFRDRPFMIGVGVEEIVKRIEGLSEGNFFF